MNRNPLKIKSVAIGAGLSVALVAGGSLVGLSAASADESATPTAVTASAVVDGGELTPECVAALEELEGEMVEDLTAEDIAEIETLSQALRDALDAAGVSYTMETDSELGIEFPMWDETDEAANAVVDGVFEEVFADDFAGIEEEMTALTDAFDAAGVEYTVDEHGFPIWDETDEAANAIADQVFEDVFGEEMELTEDDVAAIRAEAQALRDAFDAAGVSYTLETDAEIGVEFPVWDEGDAEANRIAEDVFEATFGAELEADGIPADCIGSFMDLDGEEIDLDGVVGHTHDDVERELVNG